MKRKPKPLRKLDKVKRHFLRQWGTCPLCHTSMEKEFIELTKWLLERFRQEKNYSLKRRDININYDHIIPLSKGGKDNRSNKQLTHAKCNSLKGNKFLIPLHTL